MGDSIIHPATIGKLPGQKWPLNETDRAHLLQVLPALVRTHHAVAFMNSQTHEVNDDLGLRIMNEIEDLVSKRQQSIPELLKKLLYFSVIMTEQMLSSRKNTENLPKECSQFQSLG